MNTGILARMAKRGYSREFTPGTRVGNWPSTTRIWRDHAVRAVVSPIGVIGNSAMPVGKYDEFSNNDDGHGKDFTRVVKWCYQRR
jgi:hypothetical protein